MKTFGILCLAGLCLVGCSSSDDVVKSPAQAGEGIAANPSGKPRTPEEQALADKMSAAGQAQSQAQGSDAAKMTEALKKAGK